ncbi:hypothetical protein Tco_0952933 [Tanacetum coccineum]|uniref:Uncharacterized protein n=1 Tax=Tanacetum coccineum TaxID=301880 RepID=A0ABQ5E1A1_9ASTR
MRALRTYSGREHSSVRNDIPAADSVGDTWCAVQWRCARVCWRVRRPREISMPGGSVMAQKSTSKLRAESWDRRDWGPEMEMESSTTREYSSLIQTFFMTHTVGGVFLRDEDRALYEEMLRLQDLGSNMSSGVPYTEDEIMSIVRRGKQRGHILGVGRILPGHGTDLFRSDDKMSQMLTQLESQPEFGSASGSDGCGDDESGVIDR